MSFYWFDVMPLQWSFTVSQLIFHGLAVSRVACFYLVFSFTVHFVLHPAVQNAFILPHVQSYSTAATSLVSFYKSGPFFREGLNFESLNFKGKGYKVFKTSLIILYYIIIFRFHPWQIIVERKPSDQRRNTVF